MFQFQQESMLVDDREDLIGILQMRFGSVPPEVIQAVYQIQSFDRLERLILVAANAKTFKTFLEEMNEGEGSFKILGDRFNPIDKA